MSTAELKMAQRGIITIPKTLREAYGLEPGDTFTLVDLEDGVFVLSRQRSEIRPGSEPDPRPVDCGW